MESKANKVHCYNRGCGQTFDPEINSESCTYHPGTPVFHDAYKGWSCCSKKTTDFTEFLNIKGCTVGQHSSVKPIELEKIKETPEIPLNNVPQNQPIKPNEPMIRPNLESPMVPLKSIIGSSLKSQLEILQTKIKSTQAEEAHQTTAIGTSCKNGGCRKSFQIESDHTECCMYHPGSPIFHEGMKYWTCCLKKTSDFNSFLEQVGCTVGKHTWVKVKSLEELKQSCRYDWYQTGPNVFLSVYAKLPLPDESSVEANAVRMKMMIVFDENKNTFELDLNLVGIVDVGQSSVTYSANKVEVKLKKAEPMNWPKLSLPPVVKEIAKTSDNVDFNSLSIS